jgi:hypothetical protein
MIYEPLILIITGIGAFIIQMIYFIKDERPNNTPADKNYWHIAGGVLHVWAGYAIARITHDWRWGFLMSSLMWYFFDGCVNSFALGREWWYIGTTAIVDKVQRACAGYIHIEPRLFSACLKNAALILSIILLISHLL